MIYLLSSYSVSHILNTKIVAFKLINLNQISKEKTNQTVLKNKVCLVNYFRKNKSTNPFIKL